MKLSELIKEEKGKKMKLAELVNKEKGTGLLLGENKRSDITRLCDELAAGLEKAGVKVTSNVKSAIKASIQDAWEAGSDYSFERAR